MGTRADFYIGRGLGATWIGSVSNDGYPFDKSENGTPLGIIKANNVWSYILATMHYSMINRKFIRPTEGWPWPWESSRMTDYAYAYDAGKVWVSCFGRKWVDIETYYAMGDGDDWPEVAEDMYPIMKKEV